MTRLVLKCGDIEIEYDGPEEFLKQELPQLIRAVAELRANVPAVADGGATGAAAGGAAAAASPTGAPLSVSTIAQKLGSKTGPDLIMASALSIVLQGRGTFTKRDLRDRMKEAPSFYKATYSANFDKTVSRLTKAGKLHHNNGTTYSLPEKEKSDMAARLQPQA
jgi:hypothetical protein